MVEASLYPPETRVDRWELRCRFNNARYLQRHHGGEFNEIAPKRNPIKPEWNLPPEYKFTVEWFFFDRQTGELVADGHYYVREDGTLTEHDPKHLRIHSRRYALYRGSGWWTSTKRDPTIRMKRHGVVYRLYVAVRRFTCRRWGW